MATVIPDDMPADWVPDVMLDHPDRVRRMGEVYAEGLDRLGVPGIMDALREMCLASVEEGTETVNVHLTPASVESGTDVA